MSDISTQAVNECAIALDLASHYIVFASPAIEQLFGYSPAHFNHNPDLLFEIIDPAYRAHIKEKVSGMRDGEQLNLYYPVVTASNGKKWVQDRKSIAENSNSGQRVLLSLFSAYNPKTGDAKDDALVREQFLNSLIDSQTNFLIRFDVNGCFTFANKQFLRKLGYKKNELQGKHFAISVLPGEMDKCQKAFTNCLKNPGKVIPLAHKKRDKAGNIFDTDWEFVSVVNDDGVVMAIQGIGHDVTEEKRAQEESLWIKNNLEALINNTEDQIWSVDKDSRYVYMNKAYKQHIHHLTGIAPEPGDYPHRNDGFSEDEIAQWNNFYERALTGERYSIINETEDPVSGKLLSFEISFNPIYKMKGHVTGAGCFARNITEWLESEKAIVDQNDRLRHIASLTSHELRRPVASMLGLINILDRKNFFNPDNQEIIEHLFTVGNEIDEVIRLIVDKTILGERSREKP